MAIKLTREQLLQPLQQISGVVERKQNLPILSTVLFQQEPGLLRLTGTDTELELCTFVTLEQLGEAQFTVPGRKLVDICRSLPENAEIEIINNKQDVTIISGSSKFKLLSLSPEDFPVIEEEAPLLECQIASSKLLYLLQHTQYAMAQQDVRYYLNGTFFEFFGNRLRGVTIDGHRMAYAEQVVSEQDLPAAKIIVPRKGVSELSRLLADEEGTILLKITRNHLQVSINNIQFTSKLIDGQYPDYRLVMPRKCDNHLVSNKKKLQQALQRVSVLSTEKFKGVSFELSMNNLTLIISNMEQEQAEESIALTYDGQPVAMAFNAHYLQEALNALSGEEVRISFLYNGGSVLIEDITDESNLHVIMPMRL